MKRLILIIALSFSIGTGYGFLTKGTRIYWVSQYGNDNGPCTDIEPCKDLKKTLNKMLRQDQMIITKGTYVVPQTFILTLMRSRDAEEQVKVNVAYGAIGK